MKNDDVVIDTENLYKPCEFDSNGWCIHHKRPSEELAATDRKITEATRDELNRGAVVVAQMGIMLRAAGAAVGGENRAVVLERIIFDLATAYMTAFDRLDDLLAAPKSDDSALS